MPSPTHQVDLIIKKPVALLNRELNINYKDFFINLGKAAISGLMGDAKDAMENATDSLNAVGLGQTDENILWRLVSKSLLQALTDLVEDYRDLFVQSVDAEALADLAERVEHTMSAVEVGIDARFFENQQNLSLLDDFKSALVFWLKGLGFDEFQAEAFHYRLRGQFVLALHKEWASDAETYAGLLSKLDTPFTQATLNQRSKLQYNAWLQKQANERVFSEAFGLRQVYIPLRAYYVEKPKSKNDNEPIKRIVVDLHTEIQSWITHFDADDAIRVISGGPGSGKSSFSKVLAADLAEMNEVPVLFIPLHHFNINDSLVKAVEQFVYQDPILRINPLDAKEGEKRLLIIFDGLDELSMQGKAADATARDFVDEVLSTFSRFNNRDMKWQALITGRDLSVQASETRLRNQKQIIYLLPYYLDLESSEVKDKNYKDTNNLLKLDQRNQWWQLFGKAKGTTYSSLPNELAVKNLIPITTEPLLNYLVALSYERKKIDFNKDLSLNTIYYDLLGAVYERQYAGCHANVKNLTFEEFLAILEEIALAVWHGNGRTASESYLIERCKEAGLDNYLERYSENAKTGVVRLLTAFYFRQFGTESNNDRTFEFTHKSFGEYLTARHIIGTVEIICEERERNKTNPRSGWSIEKSLIEWMKITGYSSINRYLSKFILKEHSINRIIKKTPHCQEIFLELLQECIKGFNPIEKIDNTNLNNMLKLSLYSEHALLLICAIFADKTRSLNYLDYDNIDFKAWVQRIQPKYLPYFNLKYVDLDSCLLSKTIFYRANLENINLSESNLKYSDFRQANLRWANLTMSLLLYANFEEADLTGANFEFANLEGANLKNATLYGANFKGANLNNTILDNKNWREITKYDEYINELLEANADLLIDTNTESSD